MKNSDLRQRIGREEFDYQSLMWALNDLAAPRAKVTAFLKKGVIIRVKKGLYVFGKELQSIPYSRELLANLIYGPSFVSLDYALSYHGLVPERVTVLTSVTPKRPKRFSTPVGTFVYRHSQPNGFHIGMNRAETPHTAFLIAGPERALADKLWDMKGVKCRSKKEMEQLLFTDLRIDRDRFWSLDAKLLNLLSRILNSKRVELAATLIQKEKP